jgi:excisionase family DNA binding protein
METEKLLTRREAAELLRLTAWTIRRYEKQGRLHPVRLSQNAVRIRESEILAMIAAGSK